MSPFFCKRRIARVACGAFGAVAALDFDFGDATWNIASPARFAAEARPACGVRAQLMVDVKRFEHEAFALCKAREHIEEDDRIDPAGKTEQQPVAAPDHRAQALGDVREKIERALRSPTSLRL